MPKGKGYPKAMKAKKKGKAKKKKRY